MLKASRGFMVGKLSTESCKCNSFNQDRYFGNDRLCPSIRKREYR